MSLQFENFSIREEVMLDNLVSFTGKINKFLKREDIVVTEVRQIPVGKTLVTAIIYIDKSADELKQMQAPSKIVGAGGPPVPFPFPMKK